MRLVGVWVSRLREIPFEWLRVLKREKGELIYQSSPRVLSDSFQPNPEYFMNCLDIWEPLISERF
jgi:hypothetical protein